MTSALESWLASHGAAYAWPAEHWSLTCELVGGSPSGGIALQRERGFSNILPGAATEEQPLPLRG